MKKLFLPISLTLNVVLIAFILAVYFNISPFVGVPPGMENFICAHPDYTHAFAGKNKTEVRNVLGKAEKEIVKADINEYRFGQGEMEGKIKEGWIYRKA